MKLTTAQKRLVRLALSIAAASEDDLAACWPSKTKESKAAVRLARRFRRLAAKLN